MIIAWSEKGAYGSAFGRLGQPTDIADVGVFLVSEQAHGAKHTSRWRVSNVMAHRPRVISAFASASIATRVSTRCYQPYWQMWETKLP